VSVVPTREDTHLVTVSVADRLLGIFDQKSGGEIDSEESKYNPGGMLGEISLGGRKSYGNVTVERYYDVLRDHPLMTWLAPLVGKARVAIGIAPQSVDGVVQGDPYTYSGTLKTVSPPDVDSTGTDAGKWSIEITVDSFA
jgi:hypothetical protein